MKTDHHIIMLGGGGSGGTDKAVGSTKIAEGGGE